MAIPTAAPDMLDHLEADFHRIAEGPDALTVDGCLLGPTFPQHPISLVRLRALVLAETTPYVTRDRALSHVAARARLEPDPWFLGFAWLLLPRLRRMVTVLSVQGADRIESAAEVVAGTLGWLTDGPQGGNRIAASACWHAYKRARRRLGITQPSPVSPQPVFGMQVAPPPTLSANPEVVLAAAVRVGVITPGDAEIVAATRLDRSTLTELAPQVGMRRDSLKRRRARAEATIAGLLDTSAWAVIPDREGRLGARWGRMLARREQGRRAAMAYRPRPGARTGFAEPATVGPALWSRPTSDESAAGRAA